jgi:hypothetical protein
MLALGLIFQISRYTTHALTNEGENNENTRGRRGVGRTRNTSGRRYQGA